MIAIASVPESRLDILQQETQGVVGTLRHTDGRISTNPVAFDRRGERIRFTPRAKAGAELP